MKIKKNIKTWTLSLLALTILLLTGFNCQAKTEYIHVGPNWNAIHNLKASEGAFSVKIKGDARLETGDTIKISVKSKKEGRLWVIQVDAEDTVSLLFPNKKDKDNRVAAGKWHRFPADDSNYRIVATKPLGKSTIAAIVTTGETTLDDVFQGQKSMSKALTILPKEPAWGVAHIVVDVKE